MKNSLNPSEYAAPHQQQLLRSAWFYHPTGVQLAQLRWMNKGGAASRRIVYNSAKRPIAVYDDERLIARYHYDSRGERIAKTVYPARPALTTVANSQTEAQGDTTYSLYRDQRLAAETDGAGRITAHYVYLYGKPVAKIGMEADGSGAHRLWKAVTLRTAANASDTVATIYAIVTDHLGTPQQVLDGRRQVVWQAATTPFGQARVTYARATGANARPFVMNLRLPGQVFDAETNLHYNYLRDYDPAVGRYTAPDPAGLGGGSNPYAYVSNNPLTNIDPLGLYQIDVHYYMTFFLAVTAGVDKDTARRIAVATQYIDDNPATSPTPAGYSIESMRINQPALDRYHFIEAGYDPDRTWQQEFYKFTFSRDSATYIADRIRNPASPQLARLLAASTTAKTDPNATCNSSAQLYGEYLHAFEDTFAHRDANNVPYTAETFGYGTGHATDGENPDYTYNHFSWGPGFGFWNTNEARTFEMEKEVFEKMKGFSNSSGRSVAMAAIENTLSKFNSFEAHEGSKTFDAKIAILNDALKSLGYNNIDLIKDTSPDRYNKLDGSKNRDDTLGKLNQGNYVGAILPKGALPTP